MSKNKQTYVPIHAIDDPAEDNPYLKADPVALAALIREVLGRKAAERQKPTSGGNQ